jgi:hypothetical protein
MVTKLSIAIAIAIGMCIGSGLAQPDLQTFTAAPASTTSIDFDQSFADVTRQGAGWVHKTDRLPSFKTVLPEPALLPYCEPLASPFTDSILGHIVGRCDA